jgi:hypothetical protein
VSVATPIATASTAVVVHLIVQSILLSQVDARVAKRMLMQATNRSPPCENDLRASWLNGG